MLNKYIYCFQCSRRYCRRDGYSVQKRPVFCALPNGTRSELGACDSQSRPKHKRLCKTKECDVVWQTSGWSEVRSCDVNQNLHIMNGATPKGLKRRHRIV